MSFQIKHGLFKYDLTDHYAILGIPINADAKQVRKQYLKIARNLHPDTVKAKGDVEKKQASDILSKLVNPAYEELSKNTTQAEYELVLKQTGKRLAGESAKVSLESDSAKQLAKNPTGSLDAAYQSAVKQLASSHYKDLSVVLETIGQLSELNLVYLIRKQGQLSRQGAPAGTSTKGKPKPSTTTTTPQTTQGNQATGQTTSSGQPKRTSMAEPYIRRAQEYISKKNYAKAVLELRDAIKLEPNNSMGHALLGLTYLKQNQLTMAKVHINKALASNPQEQMAIQGKQALERLTGQSGKSAGQKAATPKKQDSSQQQKKGLFGGMFGGKKK